MSDCTVPLRKNRITDPLGSLLTSLQRFSHHALGRKVRQNWVIKIKLLGEAKLLRGINQANVALERGFINGRIVLGKRDVSDPETCGRFTMCQSASSAEMPSGRSWGI